jgi:two-component system NtrC family sensor kinase
VQNLRTFSRLDKAEFKKVDIHEGLDATLRLLSRYFASGQTKLERDYTDLPQVDCYAGQLNQVWMNLIANAAQSLKDGGSVKISTRRERESVVVEIRDSGCGIPSKSLSKIFDPFYTTKPVSEGTGLGLSMTHSIIERHKGSIEVQSDPDCGTIFTVVIPINAKPRGEEQAGAILDPYSD